MAWPHALLLVCVASAGLAAPLQLESAHISHAVAVCGEPVEITARLENTSSAAVTDLAIDLYLPPGWTSDPVRLQLPSLAPFTTHLLRFHAKADEATHGGGRLVVTAPSLGDPLLSTFPMASVQPLRIQPARYSMRERAMVEVPEDGTIYVTTGSYIVFLPRCGDARGPGLVYLRDGEAWERVATFPAMGRLVYEDDGPNGERGIRADHWVFPTKTWVPRDPVGDYLMTLKEEWTDFRGRQWFAKMWLGPTTDPRLVKCTHAFWCSGEVKLFRFEGPMLSAGDGTFGTARPAFLAPTPVAATGAEPLTIRNGLAADGAMGVQRPGGGVIGLIWDPRQLWVSGKARPQALFSSPNEVYRRNNHYLSLVVPHFATRQAVDAVAAEPPLTIPARRPVYLRSELYVSAAGTFDELRRAQRERAAAGLLLRP